jgi:RNA-directed DNA polymerase
MTLSEKNIKAIKFILANGKSIDALLDVLNIMIASENREKKAGINPVKKENLQNVLTDTESYYRRFSIPKKSDGVRAINAPNDLLKLIQRYIHIALNLFFDPHPSAHGFIEGKSIVSNAKSHVSKKYVLNIDLRDFFPSINIETIKKFLLEEPFYLTDYMATVISELCTYKKVLPQGAPTSPIITNIVGFPLDIQLQKFSDEKGLTYSRYVDDITFSSDEYVYDPFLINEINDLINQQGFSLNWKKFRLQKYYHRQEVTGVIVNEKLNNNRQFIRKVRAMLHNWKTKGIEECQSALEQKYYVGEKGFQRYSGRVPDFKDVLLGNIMFLGMVRGNEDEKYRVFMNSFEKLNSSYEG